MKTITVKVMGRSAEVLEDFEGSTIQDVKAHLDLDGNYTVNMAGKPAQLSDSLVDGAYLVFAPSVKGAAVAKKATAKRVTKKTPTRSVNPNKKVSKKSVRK